MSGVQEIKASNATSSLGSLGDKLREAGAGGKHPSNVERDVLRATTKALGSDA